MDKLGYLCYCRYQIVSNKKVSELSELSETEKKAWEEVAVQCLNLAKVEIASAQLVESTLNDARKHNESLTKKVEVVN